MSMQFIRCLPASANQITTPYDFMVLYTGGKLEISMYDRVVVNNEIEKKFGTYDPWFEHDRRFIEAVKTRDSSLLLNDYQDGLYTLAPVLAGLDSARKQGEKKSVPILLKGS